MPKDPSKNIDRYKIRGGQLNPYEYQQTKTLSRNNRTTGRQTIQPMKPVCLRIRPKPSASGNCWLRTVNPCRRRMRK